MKVNSPQILGIWGEFIFEIPVAFYKFCIRYTKSVLEFANIKKYLYLCTQMIVTFEETYLEELYTQGKANDKKHRFQPHIVDKYIKVINLMKQQENVLGLTKYGSLHYEKLLVAKKGISSVKVNDQYRIEFIEETEEGKQIATICNITELSNHYK
jgi:proteic killer suppression protein